MNKPGHLVKAKKAVASKKRPTRATAILRLDKRKSKARGDIPGTVINLLGGCAGDQIVFELGCDKAVMEAALRGPYVVARLVRAPTTPQPAQVQASSDAPERPPAPARQSETVPFSDLVKRKIKERSAQ